MATCRFYADYHRGVLYHCDDGIGTLGYDRLADVAIAAAEHA
jgi:hypothetical protein